MKKKLAFVLLFVLIFAMITSCSEPLAEYGDTFAPELEYDGSELVTEYLSEEIVETVNEEISEEPESVETEPVENKAVLEDDPYAFLIITEEYAKENYATCLYRNGKLYSLSTISSENCKKYNKGWFFPGTLYPGNFDKNASGPAQLNHDMGRVDKVGNRYITAGDLPELVLQEGDELRCYDSGRETLDVKSAEIVGYSPEMMATDLNGGSTEIVWYEDNKSEFPTVFETDSWKDFRISDDSGNVIIDDLSVLKSFLGDSSKPTSFIDLQYGKEYWFHCREEFDEYDWPVVANCKVYDVLGEFKGGGIDKPAYHLKGTIDTVNKCYTYDYSEVKDGLYCIDQYLVTVKR